MVIVMMTAWGRVTWETPVPPSADIAVAIVPVAIGAALGDILPGLTPKRLTFWGSRRDNLILGCVFVSADFFDIPTECILIL